MAADRAHNGEIPTETDEGSATSRPSRLSDASPRAHAALSTSDRVAARTRETMRSLKLSSVGIELALSVLIGMFAGRWLDGKLGTAPWLMIVCLAIGFGAGLRSIMRTMDRASRAEAREAQAQAQAQALAGDAAPRGERS